MPNFDEKDFQMTAEEIEALSAGVRDLVVRLNKSGFKTVDSGDGTNYRKGMLGASPFPMVVIQVDDPDHLVNHSHFLALWCRMRGIDFTPPTNTDEFFGGRAWPTIEASYNPEDGVAVLMLTNVLSKDLK